MPIHPSIEMNPCLLYPEVQMQQRSLDLLMRLFFDHAVAQHACNAPLVLDSAFHPVLGISRGLLEQFLTPLRAALSDAASCRRCALCFRSPRLRGRLAAAASVWHFAGRVTRTCWCLERVAQRLLVPPPNGLPERLDRPESSRPSLLAKMLLWPGHVAWCTRWLADRGLARTRVVTPFVGFTPRTSPAQGRGKERVGVWGRGHRGPLVPPPPEPLGPKTRLGSATTHPVSLPARASGPTTSTPPPAACQTNGARQQHPHAPPAVAV